MTSELIVTAVDSLQKKMIQAIKSQKDGIGIYVSLNKTAPAVEKLLTTQGVNAHKIFFIDCVNQKKEKDDVLYIAPNALDTLEDAINTFTKEIPEKKYIIIDALATLLIYNDENKVASFVKAIITNAQARDTKVIALSPITKGEDLLNKIFNFFDSVEKGSVQRDEKNKDGESWIY